MRRMYRFITLWLVASVDGLIKPVYEDDPELYQVWTPSAEKEYYSYTSGAVWTGNLFAGRAEFPWVVDVREPSRDQDWWATGNLMAAEYVLTNCRAFKRFTSGELSAMKISLVVRYCPTYIFEDQKKEFYKDYNKPLKSIRGKAEANDFDTGDRAVKQVHIHVGCGTALSYDLAVLALTRKIRPVVPVVLYMPVAVGVAGQAGTNYLKSYVVDVDLSAQVQERRLCYVGSIGRDWNNWHGHMVVDYKVRYRVYIEDKRTCEDASNKFQLDNDTRSTGPNARPAVNDEVDPKQTSCFITRARVGTVCDHDRGAPLVCDGLVFGFIVRGASHKFCSNLLPMPFLIVKASIAVDYYNDVAEPYFEQLQYTSTESNVYGASQGVQLCHRCSYLNAFFIVLSLKLGVLQIS